MSTINNYLTNETGSFRKLRFFSKESRQDDISFVIAFPDLYQRSIPNIGHQVLYRELAMRNDVIVDRVYLPSEEIFPNKTAKNLPLLSWEKKKPIASFDILAFSIPFEGLYSNVLKMMELANIPIFSNQRKTSVPFLLGGGIWPTFNPEPLADFFDAFLIGEGEDVIHEFIKVFSLARKNPHMDVEGNELLYTLAKIPGVYIPSLYEVCYTRNNKISKILPKEGAPKKVKRRVLKNFNEKPAFSIFITSENLYKEPRFGIQISRGCGEHCRFCYLGYGFRKPRELKIQTIINLILENLSYTNFIQFHCDQMSKDHVVELFSKMEELIDEKNLKLSIGSMRADILDENIVRVLAKGGERILVVAPEAPEGHLRNMINKGIIKDEHILRAVEYGAKVGIPDFGLNAIIGLPMEKESVMKEWAELIKSVRDTMNSNGNQNGILEIRLNPFFPKPCTPLQWAASESPEKSIYKLDLLEKLLSEEYNVSIELNYDPLSHINSFLKPSTKVKSGGIVIRTVIGSVMCYTQTLLSRGDRRVSQVLYTAYKNGDTLNAWKSALSSYSLSFKSYFRQRELTEILPWSIIDSGINAEYLISEWKKAIKGVYTPPCSEGCNRCGIC